MGTPSRSSSVRPEDWAEALASHEDGTVIAVYAQPRASRSAVSGLYDGMVKVALAASPVDGKANKALLRFLADVLGVSRSSVSLVAGKTGRRKRVLAAGCDPERVAAALCSK